MRYILEIRYLGTLYHGWQKQENANTVQEELENVLTKILREDIKLNGSSRTDTGVHAYQQFAHFDYLNSKINTKKIKLSLNRMLPDDISIVNFYCVSNKKHTRFDAISRMYEYEISYSKNPFNSAKVALYPNKYDINKMNEAAMLMIKHTDFQCFSKVKTDVNNFNCSIEYAYWENLEDGIIFKIKANRFLRGMVRAIVGTLLDIGSDKLSLQAFETIIQSKNRNNAGNAAKAEGLVLKEVNYPEKYFEPMLSIEKIKESEIEIARQLFQEYADQLGISLCFQGFTEELEKLPGKYAEPHGSIFIAKYENNLAGIVAIKPLENNECELKRLYVKKEYQGLGIGENLTLFALTEAKQKGYSNLKLDTLKRLTAANKLYYKLDFHEIEPYNFNPEEDIIYFEKTL